MVIIVNVIKHWFFIWGLVWVFWGGIALMGTMTTEAPTEYYLLPLGILIMGIGSLYYGKDWYNDKL